MNKIIHPLKPIYDAESKVLILGSFPSVISREEMMYYANPNNRFWKVLSTIFDEEIEDKEDFCHRHHIALWDVIHSCAIQGSSDSSIQDVIYNDFDVIFKQCEIQMIICTGKKAGSLFKKAYQGDIPFVCLPSTSSANAGMSLDSLVESYRLLKEYCDA